MTHNDRQIIRCEQTVYAFKLDRLSGMIKYKILQFLSMSRSISPSTNWPSNKPTTGQTSVMRSGF